MKKDYCWIVCHIVRTIDAYRKIGRWAWDVMIFNLMDWFRGSTIGRSTLSISAMNLNGCFPELWKSRFISGFNKCGDLWC